MKCPGTSASLLGLIQSQVGGVLFPSRQSPQAGCSRSTHTNFVRATCVTTVMLKHPEIYCLAWQPKAWTLGQLYLMTDCRQHVLGVEAFYKRGQQTMVIIKRMESNILSTVHILQIILSNSACLCHIPKCHPNPSPQSLSHQTLVHLAGCPAAPQSTLLGCRSPGGSF